MGDLFHRFQKECCTCRVIKQHDDFHNRKTSPDGKQSKCKQCVNEYSSQYRRDNREKLQAARNYGCKKYLAQQEVSKALKRGDIEKPEHCEECTEPGPVIGHHDDYDFPLILRWLCCACHGAWHSENGEAANAR